MRRVLGLLEWGGGPAGRQAARAAGPGAGRDRGGDRVLGRRLHGAREQIQLVLGSPGAATTPASVIARS